MEYEREIWRVRRDEFGRFKATDVKPEALFKAACEYFQWVDSNSYYKSEQLKKPFDPGVDIDGRKLAPEYLIQIPVKRNYSKHDLATWMGCGYRTMTQFFSDYRDHDGYKDVIDWIESTIFSQQFNGAATGFFNASIISASLGLVQKTEIDQTVRTKEKFKLGDKEFEL